MYYMNDRLLVACADRMALWISLDKSGCFLERESALMVKRLVERYGPIRVREWIDNCVDEQIGLFSAD